MRRDWKSGVSQLVLAKSGVTAAVASNTHMPDPLSIMPAHPKSIFVRCRDQIKSMGRWTAPTMVVLKLITTRTSPPKTNLQSRRDLRFRKFSSNGAEIHSCGNPIWQSAPIFMVCRNSGLSHWRHYSWAELGHHLDSITNTSSQSLRVKNQSARKCLLDQATNMWV